MNYVREKLALYGVDTLSTAELISLALCASGKGERITKQVVCLLETYPQLSELAQLDVVQLVNEFGLRATTATRLHAVFALARRLTIPTSSERYQITCAADAARLLTPFLGHLSHEEMRVLVLDTKNYVCANLLLYQGTVNTSVLRVAELFRPAITRQCSHIIVGTIIRAIPRPHPKTSR